MKIIYQATAEAVAKTLAEDLFVQELGKAPLHLAVSGGSTPRALFELLVSPEFIHRIRWEHLHLYWVDERCVPPTDEQSNYGMTEQAMLRTAPIPAHQVHRIQGEAEPQGEAERYTQLVCSQLPTTAEGLPIFDAIILGIGDDGHTSSIFPHQMELLSEGQPYEVAEHPTSGQKRICLTGQTILQAKRLLFHAVGAGKATILGQIQQGAEGSEAYPSTYIAQHRPDTLLYTNSLEA